MKFLKVNWNNYKLEEVKKENNFKPVSQEKFEQVLEAVLGVKYSQIVENHDYIRGVYGFYSQDPDVDLMEVQNPDDYHKGYNDAWKIWRIVHNKANSNEEKADVILDLMKIVNEQNAKMSV